MLIWQWASYVSLFWPSRLSAQACLAAILISVSPLGSTPFKQPVRLTTRVIDDTSPDGAGPLPTSATAVPEVSCVHAGGQSVDRGLNAIVISTALGTHSVLPGSSEGPATVNLNETFWSIGCCMWTF